MSEPRRFAAGRVAFLAMADDVRAQIQAGHPVIEIYRDRKEKLAGICYEQFAKYVRRYIGSGRQRHEGEGTTLGGPGGGARATGPARPVRATDRKPFPAPAGHGAGSGGGGVAGHDTGGSAPESRPDALLSSVGRTGDGVVQQIPKLSPSDLRKLTGD
jgi:hypothetical protein